MMPPQEKPLDLWTDEEIIERYGHIAQVRPWPVSIGKLRRLGWSGAIRTYLVWCAPCRIRPNRGFTVAHPAGRGRLECGYCGRRYDHLLPSRKAKDALLNPHAHPWFLTFLVLVGTMLILALR